MQAKCNFKIWRSWRVMESSTKERPLTSRKMAYHPPHPLPLHRTLVQPFDRLYLHARAQQPWVISALCCNFHQIEALACNSQLGKLSGIASGEETNHCAKSFTATRQLVCILGTHTPWMPRPNFYGLLWLQDKCVQGRATERQKQQLLSPWESFLRASVGAASVVRSTDDGSATVLTCLTLCYLLPPTA